MGRSCVQRRPVGRRPGPRGERPRLQWRRFEDGDQGGQRQGAGQSSCWSKPATFTAPSASIGTVGCAIRGSRRSARARGRLTRCSRRADLRVGGDIPCAIVNRRRRRCGPCLSGGGSAAPGPAETSDGSAAIARIQRARSATRLRSSRWIRPPWSRRGAVDLRQGGGPLAGQPILIKDNIESGGAAADDGRKSGPRPTTSPTAMRR